MITHVRGVIDAEFPVHMADPHALQAGFSHAGQHKMGVAEQTFYRWMTEVPGWARA